MPILFRCENCRQKLSIPSRKAGTMLKCPKCAAEVMVPIPQAKLVEDEPDAEKTRKESSLPQTRQLEKAGSGGDEIEDKAWAATRELREKRPEYAETAPMLVAAAPQIEPPPNPGNLFPKAAPKSSAEEEEFELRRPRTELEEMDLTPMVDVTFLLLIFFMITASFSLTKTIETPPPDPDEKGAQTMTLEELEKTSITVVIDAEDNITIEDDETYGENPIDPSDLEDVLGDKLREERKNELIIKSSDLAKHETFVSVFDAATGAGMQKIRLASTRGEE